MQKSVQARKNRIISAMSGQFQSELPIFKTNRNTNRELKVRAIMFRCQKCKKYYNRNWCNLWWHNISCHKCTSENMSWMWENNYIWNNSRTNCSICHSKKCKKYWLYRMWKWRSLCLSINIVNFNFDNFISIYKKQLVLGLTAFFLIKIPVCRKENGESCSLFSCAPCGARF